MPGIPNAKRSHATALAAAKLHADGLTHRQIAAQLGVPADRVKKLIELGQRLRAT